MKSPIEVLRQKWRDDAAALKAAARYRTPFKYSLGSTLIDFSSNDYLGLRSDQRLLSAGAAAVAAAGGAGSGASRVVVQFDPTLDTLETFFAQWVDFPSAVYCGSGFVANCVLFDAIADLTPTPKQMCLFLDHRAHASLYAASKISGISTSFFRHCDFVSLREKLVHSAAQFKIVVVESLHSMDGTFEQGTALAALCEEHKALVIVDEAHTAGICGPHGSGWINSFPELKKHTLAVMFGCGKAVGLSGGFIAGCKELRERIFQKSKPFLYTTGVSPFLSGAVLESCRILASSEGIDLRAALQKNVEFFASSVEAERYKRKLPLLDRAAGSPFSPIFSIPMASDAQALKESEHLVAQGYLVRAMRPPTVPRNTSRLRVIVRANHSPEQLAALARALTQGTLAP